METQVNDTISKETTDAKTREINAKAKLQATKPKVTKNINSGKAITVPKTQAPKVKKVSLASELDKVLQAGGTWEALIAKADELNKTMGGHIKYSTSVLKAHIKFRTTTQIRKNLEYLQGMEVTDKGIVKSTKKGKK